MMFTASVLLVCCCACGVAIFNEALWAGGQSRLGGGWRLPPALLVTVRQGIGALELQIRPAFWASSVMWAVVRFHRRVQ